MLIFRLSHSVHFAVCTVTMLNNALSTVQPVSTLEPPGVVDADGMRGVRVRAGVARGFGLSPGVLGGGRRVPARPGVMGSMDGAALLGPGVAGALVGAARWLCSSGVLARSFILCRGLMSGLFVLMG